MRRRDRKGDIVIENIIITHRRKGRETSYSRSGGGARYILVVVTPFSFYIFLCLSFCLPIYVPVCLPVCLYCHYY